METSCSPTLDKEHVVLQLRHSSDSNLVVYDPLSMTEIKDWDVSQLQNITFEFLPHLTLTIKSRLGASLSLLRVDVFVFQSIAVLELAVTFVESFCHNKLPHVYDQFRKRVFHGNTEQRAIVKAVSYDLKKGSNSSALARSLTANKAYLEPQGTAADSILRHVSAQKSIELDLISGASTPKRLHPIPPRDLIRPGKVVQRSSSRDDVQTPVKTPKLLRQLVRHT